MRLRRAVSSLVCAKAQVGHRNIYGATALHAAASSGAVGCVRALLLMGADPLALDSQGNSARDMAVACEQEHVLSLLPPPPALRPPPAAAACPPPLP